MEKKICTLNKETLKIFTVCKVSCYHVKEMKGIDAWNFTLSEKGTWHFDTKHS